MQRHPVYDVIVVGAGVVGCSIAYHLAKVGLKVALLDQSHVGAGASGANSGLVQTNDAELLHSIPMVTASFSRYDHLEEELGMSMDFERTGILHLIPSEEYWQTSIERAQALAQAGIECEILSPARAAEVEPLLDPHTVMGALYASNQGKINPFRLMWAYLNRGIPLGISLHTYTRVTGFDVQSGRVQGVHTDRGDFSAGRVVLSTAAWTRPLGRLLDLDWKVYTFRASAMITESVTPMKFSAVISAADHREFELDGKKDVELAFLGIRQTAEGRLLIAQSDRPGETINSSISAQAPKAIATMAARYFPILRKVRLIRAWTAPTTFTDDGCPFIGPVPGLDGLILASAFRSSLVNSPIAGEIITQLVTLGRCDLIDISPFTLDRAPGSADTYYIVKSSGDTAAA